jgi:hypothetical protein
MITYKTLARQSSTFRALTGLTSAEFRHLLPALEAALLSPPRRPHRLGSVPAALAGVMAFGG